MADNTLQSGTDNIATDELATLNGGASSGVKVQRSKVGFGNDGDFRDASASFPIPVDTDSKRVIVYRGRVCSLRTPGRAGTVGQKIFTLHNTTGSGLIVDVKRIKVDCLSTAVRAITVQPALIRLWKTTAAPTGGTALTKVAKDTLRFPNTSANVTVTGDASADGTSSGTALTIALPAGTMFSQEFGSRNFTAVGQEAADKIVFLESEEDVMTLQPGQGVTVFLDYTTATFNPVTDFWTVTCDWDEYTLAP